MFEPMLINADCMDVLPDLDAASVDLLILDPPYGQSSLEWDKRLDAEAIWSHVRRLLTPTGTVALFGAGAFTIQFSVPALDLLKYALVWHKTQPTCHMHVRNRPRPQHEDIYVFSKGAVIHEGQSVRRMTYNPDGQSSPARYRNVKSKFYKKHDHTVAGTEYQAMLGASTSILSFPKDPQSELQHSSQKPLALLEWLIARYSNPGDFVLDPTCGSGSTLVAAQRLGRHSFGIERDPQIAALARDRIANDAATMQDNEAQTDLAA